MSDNKLPIPPTEKKRANASSGTPYSGTRLQRYAQRMKEKPGEGDMTDIVSLARMSNKSDNINSKYNVAHRRITGKYPGIIRDPNTGGKKTRRKPRKSTKSRKSTKLTY